MEIQANQEVLAQKTIEEQEYNYYTVKFTRKNGMFTTSQLDHPMLEKIKHKLAINNGMYVLTNFQFQMVTSFVELAQGQIVVDND